MEKISIFVFGLDHSGKTTLIEFFRQKKFLPQMPTLGVSISRIIFQKLTFEFTDVGGQESIRKQWDSYLKKPNLLVFVLDAMDRDPARIETAKKELDRILKNPKVTGIPLLVLINKVDEPLAMSRRIVDDKYALPLLKNHDIAIYEVSAMTGLNIDAVINAMTSLVLKNEAIEYFVNAEVKAMAKSLVANFKDCMQKGNEAMAKQNYAEALANFNLAKEISSNLFQIGVFTSGKEFQRLAGLVAKCEKALDEQERSMEQKPVKSYLGLLRDEGKAAQKGAQAITKLSIFLFGLDRAGKTTFVDFLKNETFKNQSPTIGVNLTTLVLGNVKFEFNDLGGQEHLRASWMDNWKGQDILIFMVDAADAVRFQDAHDALWSVIRLPETAGKPLLVLVNKCDLPEAKPRVIVESALEYHAIDRAKAIFEISVKGNLNLDKALNFIVSIVLKDADMEKFISKEIKRLIHNYNSIYEALIKEAKILEKEKQFQTAYNRVAKGRLVQEELFKHGIGRAQKEIRKDDEWLARLQRRF
jgi:small GTP-binding protein